jgi:hypothetical protein
VSSSFIYTSLPADMANGNVNTTHSFRAILCASGHTPDRLHTKRSQLTNELPTANGYTQGGAPVTLSVSTNTSTHKMLLTIGSVSWPNSSITARSLHIVRWRGGASSADELVACITNKDGNGNAADLISSSSTMAWNTPNATTWEIPLPAPV